MIKLYRQPRNALADQLEERLKEHSIAYEKRVVKDEHPPELPGDTSLPAFKEGGKITSGKEACLKFIKQLEKEIADWRKFQSDSCYIDDDGKVC